MTEDRAASFGCVDHEAVGDRAGAYAEPDRSIVARTAHVAARLEGLPLSKWHTRVRLILGSATLFDAIDVATIAFILPAVSEQWTLTRAEAGLLLSSGFAGQLIGASVCGALAERFGRLRVLSWTLMILSCFGLAASCAWGYWPLVVIRFLQGIGLGGETPTAITYVHEIAKAKGRGVFVMFCQFAYPIGFVAASGLAILVVPYLGWRWMLIVTSAPTLLFIPLRRLLPESPRWLASRGRLDEAEAILSALESKAGAKATREAAVAAAAFGPPPSRHDRSALLHDGRGSDWLELFTPRYRWRTLVLWAAWICTLMIGYGLLTWLPTLYYSVFKLSMKTALVYSWVGNLTHLLATYVGMCIVDRVGRRLVIAVPLAATGVCLLALYLVGSATNATTVLVLAGVAGTFMSVPQIALWVYTPECYPTRIRSFGTGVASCIGRFGLMVMPIAVGGVLTGFGVSAVFFLFAALGFVGAFVLMVWGTETANRVLEEVSP